MFNKPAIISFLNNRKVAILVVLLLAVTLARFYKLDGGLALGEPDEFIHQGVADSFKRSPWPMYGGVPWMFQVPLYPLLGHWLSYLFPQRYVALRIVSVFSSLLLVLGTFLFFKQKFSVRAGFLTAFLLSISPFSLYISRLALLDSTAVSFGVLSIYAQDYALERKSKNWSLIAGMLLTISLMTKYTALIYLAGFISVFLFYLVKDNLKTSFKDGFLELNIFSLLPLMVVSLLIIPALLVLWLHDKYYFKLQVFTSLGFIHDFWKIKGGELSILYYLNSIPWWLTWPVVIFFAGGLIYSLRTFKRTPLFLLTFAITALITLPFRPFYPRYFYPIAVFLIVLAGLFLSSIYARKKRLGAFLFIFSIVLILPTAKESFYSTNHRLIEDVGAYIGAYNLVNPWIFSNYWPQYFGLAAGSTKATWLSDSAWDAKAYVADINTSPLSILEKEGGFVVLESNYSKSKMFIHPGNRINAWAVVGGKYNVSKVIGDTSPNFPHQRNSSNSAVVYFVEPSK
jgi:hypothetical protein